jgi:cell division protein FtsL
MVRHSSRNLLKHTSYTVKRHATPHENWWNMLHIQSNGTPLHTKIDETYFIYNQTARYSTRKLIKHTSYTIKRHATPHDTCWNILHIQSNGTLLHTKIDEKYFIYNQTARHSARKLMKHTSYTIKRHATPHENWWNIFHIQSNGTTHHTKID